MGKKRAGDELLDEGLALYNQGRFAEAIPAFEGAIRRGTVGEKAYCFLAHALASAGEPRKALRLLEERARVSREPAPLADAMKAIAAPRETGPAQAMLSLGERNIQSGDLDRAQAQLSEALRLDPKLARAHVMLGVALEAGSRRPEARREYEEALLLDPGDSQARLNLGELCLAEGLFESAQAHFSRAMSGSEGEARGRLRLAQALAERGMFEESARCLEEGLERRPRDPELLFGVGAARLRAEQRGPTLAAFRRYLESGPEPGPQGPRRRFLALMALGDFGKAFEAADEALGCWDAAGDQELFFESWMGSAAHPHSDSFHLERLGELEAAAPGSPWPWFYRGWLLCRLKRVREGLAALDNVLEFDVKRYGWMRWEAGVRRLQLGHLDDAAADFAAVTESRPTAWWARCHLAETYLCLGEDGRALRAFERALAASPKAAEGHILTWRGAVLLWLGRYEEAVRDLDLALARGCGMAACWRGGAAMLLGRFEPARADLDRAVAACAGDAEALTFRGELKRRLGLRDEAQEDLLKVLGFCSNVWAHVNLALLHAGAEDWAGMWRCLESVPSEMLDAAARRLGKPGWKRTDEGAACRVLETVLDMAAGIRRMEGHLLRECVRRGGGILMKRHQPPRYSPPVGRNTLMKRHQPPRYSPPRTGSSYAGGGE
ncbi:MAG: tetratricopeptide repeat protein [Elusimicrobia bacterium]|nr:tetratricopeptide repeat protein [Elusimicrobiota bacterium]